MLCRDGKGRIVPEFLSRRWGYRAFPFGSVKGGVRRENAKSKKTRHDKLENEIVIDIFLNVEYNKFNTLKYKSVCGRRNENGIDLLPTW